MEDFILNEDIEVFCITAKAFPDKIMEAHQTLHGLIDFHPARKYYGLSRPDESGKIIYKAAATELVPGELSQHQLEKFCIPKGTYHCILVHNFKEHIEEIGKAFQEILALDSIDPDGICIEWYMGNNEVRCMVRQRKD